jgi:hypothetical protein
MSRTVRKKIFAVGLTRNTVHSEAAGENGNFLNEIFE